MLLHPQTKKLRDSLKDQSFLQWLLFPRKLRKVLEDENSTDFEVYKSCFQNANFFQKWFISALKTFVFCHTYRVIAFFISKKIFDGEDGESNFNQILNSDFPYDMGNTIELLKKEGLLSGKYSELIRNIIQQIAPYSIQQACAAIIKLNCQGLLTEANLLLLESKRADTHLKFVNAVIKLHQAGLLSDDANCANRKMLHKISNVSNLERIDVLIFLACQTGLFTGSNAEQNRLNLLACQKSPLLLLQLFRKLKPHGLLQGDEAQEIFESIIHFSGNDPTKLANALIILAGEEKIGQINIHDLSQQPNPEGLAQLLKSSADFALFDSEKAPINLNIMIQQCDFEILSKFLSLMKIRNIHRIPDTQAIFDSFISHTNPAIFVKALESASVLLTQSLSREVIIKIGQYPHPEIIARLLAITDKMKLFYGDSHRAQANFNRLMQYQPPELLLNFLECVESVFPAQNTFDLFNLIMNADLQSLLTPLAQAKRESLLISSSEGGENLKAIMEHRHPEALIRALGYLNKASLLNPFVRNWLTEHPNINIVNRAFRYLEHVPNMQARKFHMQNFLKFSNVLLSNDEILNLMEHIPCNDILLKGLTDICEVTTHEPVVGQARIITYLGNSAARTAEYNVELIRRFNEHQRRIDERMASILLSFQPLYSTQRLNPTFFRAASSALTSTSSTNAEILERKGVTEIPEEFICPISMLIMDNPVYIPGDNTNKRFEKKDIERWLGKNPTHPLTRVETFVRNLIEDNDLKQKIRTFVQEAHPVAVVRIPAE